MFVVMGASGNTGRATCEALLSAGERVRVVGRNPERLAGFARAGADLAIADWLDPGVLTEALEGAAALYCMVAVDPTVPDYDAHYDAASEAIAAAVSAADVSHVVNLSGIGSHLPAAVTRTMGAIDAARRHEERLNTLTGVNIVHLRPGFFMENYLRDIPALKATDRLRGALDADRPVAMISTSDIGARAAELMRRRDFEPGTALDLLGPADVAPRHAARVLGEAIGSPELEYVQIPITELTADLQSVGVGESSANAIAGIYRGYNSRRLAPARPRDETSMTPTDIDEFAKIFAEAFRAEA